MGTVLTCKDITERLKKIDEKSNKGTNGTLTVIAGSERFRGAADLAVGASLRTGCGIVRLLSVEKVVSLVASRHPSAVFEPIKENKLGMISGEAKGIIAELSKRSTAFLVGPGLGQCSDTAAVVSAVADFSKNTVIDADAINIISQSPELLYTFKRSFVITPHVGEMSRLTGIEVGNISKDIPSFAQNFANKNGVICVLKDHNTAVALPHADEIYINQSGNSGMSTGGSGDVLDGIIAGLLAQGCQPYIATTLGVYLHGLAGEFASEMLSEYSVMASDIIEALSEVFKSL